MAFSSHHLDFQVEQEFPEVSGINPFFQAEDGIRDSVASRGLGDVYKRQVRTTQGKEKSYVFETLVHVAKEGKKLRLFTDALRDPHLKGVLSLIHI